MIFTDWFPPHVLPVRNGLYIIKHARRSDCWHVGYWAGAGWYSAGVLEDNLPKTASHQLGNTPIYWWRGLTAPNAEVSGLSTRLPC